MNKEYKELRDFSQGDIIKVLAKVNYDYDGKPRVEEISYEIVEKNTEPCCFSCKYFQLANPGWGRNECHKHAPQPGNGFSKSEACECCGDYIRR